MYLIETRDQAGKLVRQHWISVKQKWTKSKAEEEAEVLAERFGDEWKHSVRSVSADEIAFAQRQGWL